MNALLFAIFAPIIITSIFCLVALYRDYLLAKETRRNEHKEWLKQRDASRVAYVEAVRKEVRALRAEARAAARSE